EIGWDVFESLSLAVRPAHRDLIDFFVFLQPEVLTEGILRDVARTALHFTKLGHLSGAYGYARANCETIAFCPEQMKEQAMIVILTVIQQQGRSFTDVEGDDVDAAVVVDVAKCRTAAGLHWGVGKTRGSASLFKGSIALVSEQQHRLLEMGGVGYGINLRVNMPV